MKRIISLLTTMAVCLLLSVSALAKGDQAEVSLSEKSYDFGTISRSDKNVTHTFTLTNTGSAPLVIISASASCGCTRPTYTTEPIAPGKTGEVKVTFVPAGQKGEINKEIKLRTNAPGAKRITLRITGTVTP